MEEPSNFRREIDIWCHLCNQQNRGIWNDVNNEFQCAICDSPFVEEVNQGIEQFLDESTVSSSRLPESRLASSTT
jgi:hypothetical protein